MANRSDCPVWNCLSVNRQDSQIRSYRDRLLDTHFGRREAIPDMLLPTQNEHLELSLKPLLIPYLIGITSSNIKPSLNSKNARTHNAVPNNRIMDRYQNPFRKDFDLPTNMANKIFDPTSNR